MSIYSSKKWAVFADSLRNCWSLQIPDGAHSIIIGKWGEIPEQLAIVGGNCSIHGFNKKSEDVLWTVTGDNVSSLALLDFNGDGFNEVSAVRRRTSVSNRFLILFSSWSSVRKTTISESFVKISWLLKCKKQKLSSHSVHSPVRGSDMPYPMAQSVSTNVQRAIGELSPETSPSFSNLSMFTATGSMNWWPAGVAAKSVPPSDAGENDHLISFRLGGHSKWPNGWSDLQG